jgi:predicted nucleic acid-binding protein
LTTLVVDSSVAVKWFVPEQHSEAAARLLDEGIELVAPDLLYAEFANVLWKKVRRSEIDAAEAALVLRALEDVPLESVPSRDLAGPALRIALETGRTAYDSLYVALAEMYECSLVTGDERLVHALASGPYARRARWLGALAP